MAKPFRPANKPTQNQPATAVAPKAPGTPSASLAPAAPAARPAPAATTNAVKPTVRIESKPAGEPIAAPTARAIAEAAYFLWLKRGGNETVNWLEAERMLRAKAGVR